VSDKDPSRDLAPGSPAPLPRAEMSVEASTSEPRRRSGFFADPVARAMAWVTGLLVMAYLATVVGALIFGMLGNAAPRTAVEQRLMVNRAAVEAGSQDPVVWSLYIDALISDGQYGRAQTMIDRAVTARYEDPAKQYFGLERARLDLARKQYEQAVKDADTTLKALIVQRDKEVEAARTSGTPTSMSSGDLGENYFTLLQVKAQALEGLGRSSDAIAVLDEYLLAKPRDADILVWRGDLKVTAGDATGALADYKDASRYLPGDTDLQKKIAETGAAK
jgi:tetratricopeptide (TPR) repeat protein